MIHTEVLIVGGGPAGSSCAWKLRQAGLDCIVLDQAAFPRVKVCAGWLTPAALRDLDFDPAAYPGSFTRFRSFEIVLRGFHFKLPARQYAIRRVEFDDYLLRRSGAKVVQHTVGEIKQTLSGYKIDGEYNARYLVGAGGTHDPVYRALFQPDEPRAPSTLVVAQEEEFAYPYTDKRCWLWFLENGLPGYAWYVPKANGYVNVGLGGKATQLKANGDSLKRHWTLLVEKLEEVNLVRGHEYKPMGHSYYLHEHRRRPRKENCFLVGDAAGLATVDMGEGISPAIRSGLLAAESILTGREYSLDGIPQHSLRSLLSFGLG